MSTRLRRKRSNPACRFPAAHAPRRTANRLGLAQAHTPRSSAYCTRGRKPLLVSPLRPRHCEICLDFGTQGAWPRTLPHSTGWPQTVKNDWNIKRTLKQIVMSALPATQAES